MTNVFERLNLKTKRQKIVAIALTVVLLAGVILAIVLPIALDRPKEKTTAEYLKEFETALIVDKMLNRQQSVSKISLYNGEDLTANFEQEYRIDLTTTTPQRLYFL